MRSFNLAEAVHKIPGALEDMLVRGAYLEHSARELAHSRQEQAARLQTVHESRPPFLFLRPKDTRSAFLVASKGTAADLEALDRALAINHRLSEHLRSRSEELLEKWLRTHCEEYRLGLAAGHFAVDWERSLARFTGHAQRFIQMLGSARNMAPAGYNHARGLFSPSAYEAIRNAHAAGLQVETEIAATNAIAEEHDRLLGRTVFNDPMPRLVHEPYAEVVAKIANMPPIAAHLEFNRVIAAVEDLLTRELEAVRARVRGSAQDHASRTHSYVHNAWTLLHAHAVAHSVDAEHIGAVVEQTERTYLLNPSVAMA